jgi:hypothetical protein
VLVVAAVALAPTGCTRSQDPTTVVSTTAAPSIVSTIAGGTDVLAPAGAPSDASTAATGSSPVAATPAGACEKARFAAHAGLGAGALHRYLWQPYQQGAFASNAPGRQQAMAEAGLAATFALREAAAALRDIERCPDTRSLASAIRSGLGTLGQAATGLATGTVDGSLLTALNNQVATIRGQAETAGIAVPDLFPSLAELATSAR